MTGALRSFGKLIGSLYRCHVTQDMAHFKVFEIISGIRKYVYMLPTRAGKMRFGFNLKCRGFCAEDRVPVGARFVAKNRGE